jgi:hypothetical protein
MAGECEESFDHLEGVAGSALLWLEDKLDPGGLDGGSDTVGFVTDDAVDLVGRDDLLCGGDNVKEEGTSTDLMENFRAFALEPRAFSCGHDGYG